MNYRATRLCQWVFAFVLASLFVVPAKNAMAQGAPGAIAGTVTDPSGAALKGAQVSIPAQDINVVSDEQGLFVIKGLAPGNYTLTISYVGFATFQKEAVTDIIVYDKANPRVFPFKGAATGPRSLMKCLKKH